MTKKLGAFDVLKFLSDRGSEGLYLAPLDNVTYLQKTKQGTKVTIAVGLDCMGIATGQFAGGLLLIRTAAFNAAKKELESQVAPADGFLEVGTTPKGDEVVINHPRLQVDEKGNGHIVFSPAQARAFARTVLKKADEAQRAAR